MYEREDVRHQWQARRGQRSRHWMKVRIGLWLAMVGIVIAANVFFSGGHFLGLGFIVISGGLMAFRIGSMWFMRNKMRQEWQSRGGGGWRGGSGGYSPPPPSTP